MKYFIAITATVFLTVHPAALSSRCPVLSVPQAFEQARSVFVGEVMSVEDPGLPTDDRLSFKVINLVRPIKVHLMVERIYSGRETKEIVIGTQTGGLEFGYEFKVGEKYLVYAVQNPDEKSELVVKGCGRTRRVEEATEDLKLLETIASRKSN